jgi:sugar phosphate isomerase/epimerase
MNSLKIVTSVAPYVTTANAFQATRLAHEDGFAGIELSEDHLYQLVQLKPNCLKAIREYSENKRMSNSIHKTLHRPSIDSPNVIERKRAIEYTLLTLDHMETAGIPRMVLHSFSDLPGFFALKRERANKLGYFMGSNTVKIYGVLAPVLKAYREKQKNKFEECFMHSLSKIAKYAADKTVNGKPIEVVFEEHFSDAIDYDSIPYCKGNMTNVIRGIDTAHRLIRTGMDTDLSNVSDPIHFHAVDTNGIIDDHRTIGNGKVKFDKSLADTIRKKLTDTVIIEDGTRRSALKSRDILSTMMHHLS